MDSRDKDTIHERIHPTQTNDSSGWSTLAQNLKETYPRLYTEKFGADNASVQMCRMLKDHRAYNAQSLKDSGQKVDKHIGTS